MVALHTQRRADVTERAQLCNGQRHSENREGAGGGWNAGPTLQERDQIAVWHQAKVLPHEQRCQGNQWPLLL